MTPSYRGGGRLLLLLSAAAAVTLGAAGGHDSGGAEAAPRDPAAPHQEAASLGLTRHHHDEPHSGGGGEPSPGFDFFVLATFWPAELCRSEQTLSCASPEPYWTSHLTGHGLWPNNADGSYPQFCAGPAFNASIPEAEVGLQAMETYWPNLSKDPASSNYDHLWDHEWAKHGTCSGMDQSSYFRTSVDLFKAFTPALLSSLASASSSSPATVSRSDLEAAFGGPGLVVLQCSGGKYLQAAMTCWTKVTQQGGGGGGGGGGGPGERMACPSAVLAEGSCSQDNITIPAFGTSSTSSS